MDPILFLCRFPLCWIQTHMKSFIQLLKFTMMCLQTQFLHNSVSCCSLVYVQIAFVSVVDW